jgi:CheY-like chemotaxis protein
MTAYAMNGDRETFLQEGMTDYVAKPLEAQDLAEAILRNLPQ